MTEFRLARSESYLSWWIAILLLLLVSFAVRLHLSTTLGTQSDEGLHITIAERVASGEILYAELFENRTPLVEWFLAITFSLVGPSIVLSRIATILITSLSLSGLALGGRILHQTLNNSRVNGQISGKWMGLAAAALFAFVPLSIFWGRFVMLEHWQTLASILSICCAMLAVTRRLPKWWLLSGIFAGFAILSKQTGIVVGFAIFSYLILLRITDSTFSFRTSILVWSAGLLSPLILTVLILLMQGSLDEFFGFISGVDRLDPLFGLNTKIWDFGDWSIRQPLLLMSIVGSIAIINQRRVLALLPVIWMLGEVVALFFPPDLDLSWGGFSHYTLPAIAALSLSGAFGIFWIVESIKYGGNSRIIASICLLFILVIGIRSLADLRVALWQTTYPQSDVTAEQRIGSLTKKFIGDNRSLLVFGNSIFYHWTGTKPASLYLHFPAYLPASPLANSAESNLITTLSNSDAGAVLISRMHLDERLSQEIKLSLFANWEPVALLPYPYQEDVFLFLPVDQQTGSAIKLAEFEKGIDLVDLNVVELGNYERAIRLEWETTRPLDSSYTVFVHLINSEGDLVAQHDGIPSTGFRPTNTWRTGETIPDWHIISMPSNMDGEGFKVAIGLYDSSTGERVSLRNRDEQYDAYIVEQSG